MVWLCLEVVAGGQRSPLLLAIAMHGWAYLGLSCGRFDGLLEGGASPAPLVLLQLRPPVCAVLHQCHLHDRIWACQALGHIPHLLVYAALTACMIARLMPCSLA